MKDAEVKIEGGDRREGKAHFKKKGGNKNKGKKQQSTADDAFTGVGFSIHREGPELYLRTIERLGLYVSTQFKNGSDVKMCLKQEKMIRTPYPDLADEHTAHEKRIWEFKMTEILKTERVLEGNLRNYSPYLCHYVTPRQSTRWNPAQNLTNLKKCSILWVC